MRKLLYRMSRIKPAHISPVGRAKVFVLTNEFNLNALKTTITTGITQKIHITVNKIVRKVLNLFSPLRAAITAVPPSLL